MLAACTELWPATGVTAATKHAWTTQAITIKGRTLPLNTDWILLSVIPGWMLQLKLWDLVEKNMDEMLKWKWWQVLSQAGTVKSSFYKTLLLGYVVGYIWSTQSWSGWDNCKSQQKIRRTWELVSNNWFTGLHLTYCRQMHFCFSDDSLDVFDLFL